jgi:hypothetical protein
VDVSGATCPRDLTNSCRREFKPRGLVYSSKRIRIRRVMMPVATKVTTVPTMPAIGVSRRCWKGHCWIVSARRWITSAAWRARACSLRAATEPDLTGS